MIEVIVMLSTQQQCLQFLRILQHLMGIKLNQKWFKIKQKCHLIAMLVLVMRQKSQSRQNNNQRQQKNQQNTLCIKNLLNKAIYIKYQYIRSQQFYQIFRKIFISQYCQAHVRQLMRFKKQKQAMINLQSSKKLLKTYDELISTGFQQIHNSAFLPYDRLTFRSKPTPRKQEKQHRSPSQQFCQTISKMIKIQFDEKNKQKHNIDIRQKRKMMTSSEKFYNRKKLHYSSFIKETHSKQKEDQRSHQTFLTIGSHAIQKMDYANTTSNFDHNLKYLYQNTEIKKRLRDNFNITDLRSLIVNQSRDQPQKVFILKRVSRNRNDNALPPATERKRATLKIVQKLQSVPISSQPKQTPRKDLLIDQFIPIRKSSAKKDPFIFGLSQKQLNPQKNKDRLLFFHDFLWKINYSNGLYVQPSSPEVLYRAYIGGGNNSNLIKSILKRRYWWTFTDRTQHSNFSWTQLKVNPIFRDQQSSRIIIDALYPPELPEQNENLKSQPAVALLQGHDKIFNQKDLINWNRHMRKNKRTQRALNQKTYKNRLQFLSCKAITKIQNSERLIVHNHLEQNFLIGNKKALFYNMKRYYDLQGKDVFNYLPLTFHITKGLDDGQFKQFQKKYNQIEQNKKNGEDVKNVWIMKPGQNSNRGNGITVCHGIDDVKYRLKAKEKNSDGNLRTFIVQKYMQKPLLYKGRKFDIRHYMLITSFNGIIKAYWYPEGYIRTSSSMYSLKRGTNLYIHLTNDAVQKNSEQYGKYQKGNKISYEKFQHYLNKNFTLPSRKYFYENILEKMKQMAADSVKSTFLTLDPHKRQHNFQLLGMDFMIDEQFKPWLIEINTNPCLELSSPLLSKLIPQLVEQVFRISVDSFFPPPQEWPSNKKMFIPQNALSQNEFQLIFDESIQGKDISVLYGNDLALDSKAGKIEEDAQVYENEGAELNQKNQ